MTVILKRTRPRDYLEQCTGHTHWAPCDHYPDQAAIDALVDSHDVDGTTHRVEDNSTPVWDLAAVDPHLVDAYEKALELVTYLRSEIERLGVRV